VQVKDWKEELEILQKELERCQSQQPQQQQHQQQQGAETRTDSRTERKEKRKMEKELRELKLNYADTLAAKESLSSQEPKLLAELEDTKQKLSTTEEALIRLRSKSKILLSKYRSKKTSYAEICVKVDSIRVCLLELRDLCRTKDENYRDILDHLGSQIQIRFKFHQQIISFFLFSQTHHMTCYEHYEILHQTNYLA
jgi:chromosome segregation ATPase